MIKNALNVLDEPLQSCGGNALTGFYRDGYCNTSGADLGSHTICCEITWEFLEYSRFRGNNLMTPLPELDFPGLRQGDRWCLSAVRWLEAYQQSMAPSVHIAATNKIALEVIDLQVLLEFARDH